MKTDLNIDICCSQCGKSPVKFHCSKCKISHYCDKKCQIAHWPEHKAICRLMSVPETVNLPNTSKKYMPPTYRTLHQLKVPILLDPPSSFPNKFSSIKFGVPRGSMRISNVHLYTHAVFFGVVLILWGKHHVAMSHVDITNSPQYPRENNDIQLDHILPDDFEFVKGIIVCGQKINLELYFNENLSLVELMDKVLNQLSFSSQLEIVEGIGEDCYVEATVKDQELNIFHVEPCSHRETVNSNIQFFD